MSIRGSLFNNQNPSSFMQSLGQNPFPMRGLERYMQRRGMSFQGPSLQRPNPQAEAGRLSNTLKVEEPPEKSGGIKAFLSRFTRKKTK